MRKTFLLCTLPLALAACGDPPAAPPAASGGTAPRSLVAAEGSAFYAVTAMTIGPKGALWQNVSRSFSGFRYEYLRDSTGKYVQPKIQWKMVDHKGGALLVDQKTPYIGGDISIASILDGVTTSLGGMMADWSQEMRVVEIPAGATLVLNAQAIPGCRFNGWSTGSLTSYVSTQSYFVAPPPSAFQQAYMAVFHCSGDTSGGGDTGGGGGGGTECPVRYFTCEEAL